MNLIDILVDRLPVLGGWPIDSDDERTLTSSLPEVSWGMNGGGYYAFRGPNDSVNYQQYENAILASRNEWDGEGLPPVGLNAEVLFINDDSPKWYSFVASYIGKDNVIAMVGLEEFPYTKTELSSPAVKFRPIRSEADKKHDALAKELVRFLDMETDIDNVFTNGDVIGFYDYVAAGKIPSIRID